MIINFVNSIEIYLIMNFDSDFLIRYWLWYEIGVFTMLPSSNY